MKRLSVFLALVAAAGASAVLTQGWGRNLSGDISTGDYLYDVAFDASGHVWVAGSTTTNSNDHGDATLFRYSPTGTRLFRYALPDWSDGLDIAFRAFPHASGCVMVASQRNSGQTSGRVVIESVSNNGLKQWSDAVTLGQYDYLVDAVALEDAYVAVISRRNTFGFDYTQVVGWSKAGARAWTNSFARSPFEHAVPSAVAANANRVAIGMYLEGTTDLPAVAVFGDDGEEIFSSFLTWIEGFPRVLAVDPLGRVTMFSEARWMNGRMGVLAQRWLPAGTSTFTSFYTDPLIPNNASEAVSAIAPVNGQAYGLFKSGTTQGQQSQVTRWIGSNPVQVARLTSPTQYSNPIQIQATSDRILVLDDFKADSATPLKARVTVLSNGGAILDQLQADGDAAVSARAFAYGPTRNVAIGAHRFTPNRTLYLKVLINRIAISQLTVDQSAVKGGRTVRVTVKLSEPAGSGGQKVRLTANSGAIRVPATDLTVPAGSTEVTAEVPTDPVHNTVNGIITATSDGLTKTVALRVDPPKLAAIRVTPPTGRSDIHTGETGRIGVELDSPAPSGFTVSVTAPASLGLGSSFVFSANNYTTSKEVVFPRATTNQTYNVSASRAGVTKSTTITTKRPMIQTLVLSREWVEGGTAFDATITVRGFAPTTMAVPLVESSPFVAGGQINVPAGALTASRTVTTTEASTSALVNINASLGGATLTKAVRVLRPILVTLTVPPLGPRNTEIKCSISIREAIPGIEIQLTKTGTALVPGNIRFDSGTYREFFIYSSPAASGTITARPRLGGKSITRSYSIN